MGELILEVLPNTMSLAMSGVSMGKSRTVLGRNSPVKLR